jgi:hypothetical protein
VHLASALNPRVDVVRFNQSSRYSESGNDPRVEKGKEVKFSSLQAVAAALGLKLELVEQVA